MSLTLHKEQQSTHNHSIIILITIIILLTVILMILALELRDMDKVFYYGIFHFILHYPYTVYCGIVHFLET